jgi:hypothetical protein
MTVNVTGFQKPVAFLIDIFRSDCPVRGVILITAGKA